MESSKNRPVLQISGLTVAYKHGRIWQEAVRDFSLTIESGQMVGLVGESGSGKTTVAMAVMGYLGKNGRITQGEIIFNGRHLRDLSPKDMTGIWGRQINLVPQDPQSALNPSMRIQEQLAEPLRQHLGMNKKEANERAVALLEMVRVPDPLRVARSYPHQISGGMQQRVMIALALSTEPRLLILDEPTTNLDVTTQAAILDLFADLIRERDTAVLYVTHNLGVVANICDHVSVLYAGEQVEAAVVQPLFAQPIHPYTQGLMASVPQLGENKARIQLQAIPGQIPSLGERPSGCVFAPRCAVAIDICGTQPSLDALADGRLVRCHRWEEIVQGEIAPVPVKTDTAVTQAQSGETLLNVADVQVYFPVNRSLLDSLARRPKEQVKAVDGVSLTINRGETLGLVGESGSGKTTISRAIIGLAPRTGGEIELLDKPLPPSVRQRDKNILRHLQYVFQNPEEALNPYMTVGETLRRPFMTLLGMSKKEADTAVIQLLADVRLPADYAQRRPGQLSGGEKQRVAIARAFATNPDLLIADEAVSALDVSVQASILNLLNDLQVEHDNALLFISHDLSVIGYLADKIAVMYVGKLMELADAETLFQPPWHPYTEALLSAIPRINPTEQQEPIRLTGDVPSQINLPGGCPFHPRCPRYLGDICATETPPWQELPGGKRIFCHIPAKELEAAQEGS